ncbi:MAG: redoxin domain-containing protein [Gammaproteobacteria bacterium]|nr:redoxin domain-containing protein [Gammaproteobacteria bacterium]
MNKIIILVSALLLTLFTLPSLATDLKVGDMAPDFKLQATNGKSYQLSHFRNRQAVILAWYPMANTRGCTIECLSLVKDGGLIRQFDVTYFMASVDPLKDNLDFAKKTKADFPMLSDPSKETAKAYDVLNIFGVASRVTFYIDKAGRIAKIDDDINPKSAAQDIANALKSLGMIAR